MHPLRLVAVQTPDADEPLQVEWRTKTVAGDFEAEGAAGAHFRVETHSPDHRKQLGEIM
jgi:hypothetical protein